MKFFQVHLIDNSHSIITIEADTAEEAEQAVYDGDYLATDKEYISSETEAIKIVEVK